MRNICKKQWTMVCSEYFLSLIHICKVMELTGVKQIDSFDANEFLLETAQGWLMIQGKDLKLGKLDTERGDVIINGIIEALSYVSNKKGNAKETMMSKLFR